MDSITKKEYKVSEVIQQAIALAAELQALGCARKTVIGIVCRNRPEYYIVLLATVLTGATITCFNPNYTISNTRIDLKSLADLVQIAKAFKPKGGGDYVDYFFRATINQRSDLLTCFKRAWHA